MRTKERKRLAALLSVSEQYIYQCITGRKNASPSLAVRLEKESYGAVTRQQLRRDWREVWPELAVDETAKPQRSPATKQKKKGTCALRSYITNK